MSGKNRRRVKDRRMAKMGRVAQASLPDHSPGMGVNPPAGRAQSVAMMAQYSGPIPPPEFLRQYESVVPGAADRIMRTFERQMEHRQSLESRVIDSDIKQAGAGMRWGGILSALALILAFFLAVSGSPGWAAAVSVGQVATLATVFVKASHDRKAAREKQRNQE